MEKILKNSEFSEILFVFILCSPQKIVILHSNEIHHMLAENYQTMHDLVFLHNMIIIFIDIQK